MRKSSGKAVDMGGKVGITRHFFHNVVFTASKAVFKNQTYTSFVRALYSALYPAGRSFSNLLNSEFYTSSTGLITKTTTLNKLLIREEA